MRPPSVYRDALWLLCAQNALMKLAGFGAVLIFSHWLFPGFYGADWRPLWLAVLALTAVGTVADVVIVPRLGNVPSLAMGWFGMTFIVWTCGAIFPGAAVPLWQAGFTALFAAPLEWALHRWILRSLSRL
ncbi:MAG: DUF2512 family protein [Thermoflavifilum sp.]|nr:DUF2512 family protein [Thermoflavifilum sp.]MCL6514372.1 YndM family protein [Alicyclobacillus sp.]